jgi:uncharacterized membrane protein YeaQ/YmgE (transglycosylase-associated protein family)
VIGLAASGFVVGGLARFAVPGPDPLSIGKTIVLGIAGSFVGGIAGGLMLAAAGQEPTAGGGDMLMSLIFALGGAVLLLVLYRRFGQGRPITGPDAHRPPDRGV